ncbi:MAG: hypothetical protein ACRC5Q_05945, partial [Culicoidibacterales bacterium]
GTLADNYNELSERHNELLKKHQILETEILIKNEQLNQLELLLSKRIVGKLNRYLLSKDSISKK